METQEGSKAATRGLTLIVLSAIFGRRRAAMRALLKIRSIAQRANNRRILGWSTRRLERYGLILARGAVVPLSVKFPHPIGIVIGEGVIIEENVHIFQNVTLGGARFGDSARRSHPKICEGATIFAGAVVLGSVIIGKDATVGANSVVLTDVPDKALAVGVPARVINRFV